MERDLESLFEAFRERGDVGALAQVFDATSDELLTVALHLVGDAAQAEDLVQATFLTAIQRAETFDAKRALTPWLVGILANQAARSRAERARSVDATRIETRVQPEPSEEIERAEVAKILARAVDELPEPYRGAVKRHVIDGERAVDIARQSGIAAGTVRMQILRGLERLRRALPAGLLGVGVWPVRGTDAIRAHVLEAGHAKGRILVSATAVSSGAGISAALWTIGGVLMTTKILLGAAVLAVAGLFLWKLSADEKAELPQVALASTSAETTARDGLIPPAPALEAARQPAQATASAVENSRSSSTGWWLRGTVSGLDGKPAERTLVAVRRIPGGDATATCDEAGRFEVDLAALFQDSTPNELLVTAEHPANRVGSAMVPARAGDDQRGKTERIEYETKVALAPFAIVTGNTKVSGPMPKDGTSVQIVPQPERLPAARPVNPEAPGRFEYRLAKGGDYVVSAVCDGCLPVSRAVAAVVGETIDIGTLELVPGSIVLEGDVRLPFDRGAIPLRIQARRSDAEGESRPGMYHASEQFEGKSQYADVDDHGHFRMTGIPAGTWQLEVESRDRNVTMLWQEPLMCTAPAGGLILGQGLGRIVLEASSAGKPCKDVTVLVRRDDVMCQGTTGADGRATFIAELSHDVPFELRLAKDLGTRARTPAPLVASARTPDMVHRVELQAFEDRKSTLVVLPVGPAPARAAIGVYRPNMEFPVTRPTELVDGKYTFTSLDPGHFTVVITPSSQAWYGMGGGEFLCNSTLEVDLVPDQVLTLPITFLEGGRVRFHVEGFEETNDGELARAYAKVVDAQGKKIPGMFVVRTFEGGGVQMNGGTQLRLDAESEFAQGLAPGTYELVLEDKVWTAPAVSFAIVAGIETKVRVPVRRR